MNTTVIDQLRLKYEIVYKGYRNINNRSNEIRCYFKTLDGIVCVKWNLYKDGVLVKIGDWYICS